MRSTLRSLLVPGLVALGGSALIAAPVTAEGALGASGASSSPLAGPLVTPSVDQLLRGEGARAARQARRSNPEAIAQRRASRSKFEGVGQPVITGEARRAFPELIEQTAGGVPTLAHGEQILRYRTNHAAEVSLPGGQRGVIESIAPIATGSGDRHLPIDLHLRDAGADFTPLRSAAPVELPKDLAEGVSLSGLGISLTPVDSRGAPLGGSEGELDGAAVLWRHSDRTAGAQDLASVAKPTSRGLELSTMLLSDRSPGKLYFHVGIPAGAHLKRESNGSVQILKGGRPLAGIAPVSAEDAEGMDVPVSMTIHGHTLVLSVQKSGDFLYPIAVDPELASLNDSQLVETAEGKHSNWFWSTTNPTHFGEHHVAGVELLETKGIATYSAGEFALWYYRTQGVSHIWQITTKTSAKNRFAKIESYLEFQEPPGFKETQKVLSTEGTPGPEYENQPASLCAANTSSKIEECASTSGKPGNTVQFEQAAGGNPGANYAFTDSMSEAIVSIAEPSGTHSTTSYDTTSPTLEVEVEKPGGGKEKVTRTNALYGSGSWLSKIAGKEGGAIKLQAADTGIGVSGTKLEYESTPGNWTPVEEHNYLAEKGCWGVQCYPSHSENWTMEHGTLLPDGEQKLRYKAEEAISGTQSLTSEGKATVKVDTKKPHGLRVVGLPYGNEMSQRPYELGIEASDGEGSTLASSGIKSIALKVDGATISTPAASCTIAKGECTASTNLTLNGAELGAGKHYFEIIAIDNAGNEAKEYAHVTIRHSTPVALGPGSVDLESGDYALGETDLSLGSGLTLSRNYSSRNLTQGTTGALGPEWSMAITNTQSLEELIDGDVLMTAADGKQTIFAHLEGGKFESPTGDSNLELTLEENKTTKEKVAYYLKDPSAHTSVKFTRPSGASTWLPTKREGTTATDTVSYTYTTMDSETQYNVPGENWFTRITIAGPDGNIWFTNHLSVGKMTPTGALTEYPMPLGHEAHDLTMGPEEDVWVAEGGKVAKIVPSTGAITEYSLGSGNDAMGITAGPDGNLWLTNYYNSKIEKMTPAGTVTTYALPTGSSPYKITSGPDGNLWFTEYGGKKIGRISTGGTITEYPTGANQPYAIATGPDKNLWFTERSGKKVGKITTSGTITEWTVPNNSEPQNIAAGPDGNVWFATNGPYTDKITPSGTISQYATFGATGVAAGSDGKIWLGGEFSIKTIATSFMVAVPLEVQAPTPAGVSCSPEAKPGCRSLYFTYYTEKSATGEGASEWGKIPGRLGAVYLHTYNTATAKMEYIKVAEYAYDIRGRLRASWDPRISPNLKKTYGYDDEGHVTSLVPPGQEPWTFTYSAIPGDLGTGRLLKVNRAPASTELWKGEAAANTAAPKITGTATQNVRLAASSGTWSGSPVNYSYQWSNCTAPGICTTIPGAVNANYTPQAADVGDTLRVTVKATNGDGSAAANSAETVTVKTLASNLAEYTLPASSGPKGMTAGPASGTLWFTDFTSSKVGKTTSSGTITEYALPASSGPEGIVKGPDGNLWVANYTSSKIAKVTTAGVVSAEYALPASSHPKSIVAGPDGNLWFTIYSKSKIGKITTSGTITEYALPTNTFPTGIAVGPDGNLWFTEFEKYKVGKITTSGTITEYGVTAGSHPRDITAGPDGNLWFTEQTAKQVGKITTSGTVTEYPLGSTPEYINSAGGALWVTGKASTTISRVSTSGTVTSFALAEGSQPQQLAANSLGEVWFAELNDKLAKFSPSVLSEGEARSPEPGSTLNYDIPISGTGAPHNMSESEVAKWGQSDVPVEATAITAPDEPQGWPASSYKRATVHYLDEHGREVNVAAPSTATYGSISTTEYNEFNDVIRTLTPDNRATALAAGASSVEKSKLLDTQRTFNGEGAKEGEVAEPGTMLVESFGPQHMIKYHAGGEGSGELKETLGREHKRFFYDQGTPGGEIYHLLTEEKDLAYLNNGEDVEVHTMKKSYSGQTNLGWKLRAPTSVTVDPAGTHENSLNLTTTTEYNASTGQVAEVRGAGAEKTLSYTTKFGEAGTEAGKLKNPWGAAVNSEGKLWVVDSANNRVEQFSSAGAYLAKFGEAGSGNGQFNAPTGIALDAAGHIWVADTANNRIQEFSSTGTYMATVGSLGAESGKFNAPSALAFDSKGNMWVADTGNSRVEKFDKEAKFASEFGAAGAEPGKLKEPKGIAVDSGEHVWVADTANNRIQEFSTTGSLLKRFGTPGGGEGQLNAPIDLKIDSSGNIWTVDSANNRAQSFSPKGAYVTQIGFKGTEAGQLTEPRSLAFDATGKAWVTDSSNNRVEQWSKGANAHDQKTIYYSAAANGEYPTCGSHPEWAGLICETLPAKQPELMGLPKLPVTTTTYNTWNEAVTVTENFGSTTRTKKETYDAAGRKSASEVTASTGTSLPKVNFTYNSEQGALEKQTTEGEGKVLSSEFNRLGQLVKYTDSDGNVAKYKYAGPEGDLLIEEVSDSSASGTSRQSYEYDPTTKLRTKLIDSAAGSFTASYDAEGALTSVSYPYSLCANYVHNSIGETTSVQYLKTSNCSESEPGIYYSDSKLSSVRGELLSQSSTLANETYAYDTAGRLTETQETPTGEGCTVRAYAYDEEGNRASSASRTPGVGGACQAEGGTIEGHNYDEANRLADGGMAYDALGNVTKLPAADAEGKELTSTFYVDNAVASQTQGGVTNEYKLDPEGRTRETITGATKTVSHYDASGETVAWTENAEQWVRNIPGIDGALLATQTNGATPVIQLHDLEGNVVGTIGDKAGETKLLSSYNSTEFGVPNAGKAPPKFAWLGATGIESSFTTGVITYGSTSYVPQTGRALQTEAVEAPGLGGGTGLGTPYEMQAEAWVMEGAARSAAEAPGREAAREREAEEAALAAAEEDPGAGRHDPHLWISLTAGEAATLSAALYKSKNELKALAKSGTIKGFTMHWYNLIASVWGDPGYGPQEGMAYGLHSCAVGLHYAAGSPGRCKFFLYYSTEYGDESDVLEEFGVLICWGQKHNDGPKTFWTYPRCTQAGS
jgi:streptogramin lyase